MPRDEALREPNCMRCFAVFMICTLALVLTSTSGAVVEAAESCDACGRAVVSEAEPASGRALCRACYRDADHRWSAIDRYRYATFADGTLIDLKHFRASMLVSQAGGLALGGACRGVACANLAGWAVEWWQVAEGHVGGQPFGGNEDLRSNVAGSVFGHLVTLGGQTTDWAERAIRFLERFHGPLQSVSDTK